MTDHSSTHPGTRLLVVLAALVIIMYGVNQAQAVVALFLVSAFLALIGTPPVLWLEHRHVPSLAAVLVVVASMIALLLIIAGILGASLSTYTDALPSYEKRLHEQVMELKGYLASKNIVISSKVLLEYLNPGAVMTLTVGLLTVVGLAPNALLIMLTVTFILLEASSFPIKLRSILGDPELAFPQVTKFVNDIRRYMIIKTLISLAAGTLIGFWLFILGVDFPILWGFLAFLLHFIPNVGPIIAAVPAVLLALIQLGGGSAALTASGYLVIGFTLGNVVEPRLMGRQLGLSTLVVFLSLIFWGGLLGPVGVILCVPFTMTLKFAFEGHKSTQWIAVLLGSEKPAETIVPLFKRRVRVAHEKQV